MKYKTIIIGLLTFNFYFTSCNLKTGEEYYKIGLKNDELNNYKKSYKYYTKAIKAKKDNPDYFIKRAEARAKGWSSENNFRKVESAYNDLFSRFAWNEEGLYSRAFYHYNYRNSSKSALANLDSLVNRYPKNIDAYILRGEIYLGKKDTNNAYSNFSKAINLTNDKKEAHNRIGIIECQKKCYTNSIKSFREAYKLNKQPIIASCHYLSASFWEINQKDSACYYFLKIDDSNKILQSATYRQIREYCATKYKK